MTDEEKAKSLILSTAYEVDGEYLGKSINDLNAISGDIQSGKPYAFEATEVQQVVAYAHKVMAVPTSRLIIDGLKWLGPPVLILTAIYLLLFAKK